MISIQDFLIVSGVNVALITFGVIIHNRWIDRKLAPKKPIQPSTGVKP